MKTWKTYLLSVIILLTCVVSACLIISALDSDGEVSIVDSPLQAELDEQDERGIFDITDDFGKYMMPQISVFANGNNNPSQQTAGSIPTDIEGWTLEQVIAAYPEGTEVRYQLITSATAQVDTGNANASNKHEWLSSNPKIKPAISPNGNNTTIEANAINGTTILVHHWTHKGENYQIIVITYHKPDEGEEAVNATLTYYANDPNARGNIDSSVGQIGNSVNVKTSPYINDGKVFASWNTKADGTGDTYQPGDTFVLENEINALYAQWKEIEYKDISVRKNVRYPNGKMIDTADELGKTKYDFNISNAVFNGAAINKQVHITITNVTTGEPISSIDTAFTDGNLPTFSLAHNEQAVISELPVGSTFNIVESENESFTPSIRVTKHAALESAPDENIVYDNTSALDVSVDDALANVVFDNTLNSVRKYASFTKKVTGKDADTERFFDFSLQAFSDAECTTPVSDVEIVVDGGIYDNQKLTSDFIVSAKHDDEITISSYVLPRDSVYVKVTELEDMNYELQGDNGRVLELTESENNTTEFVNAVGAGSLVMTKQVVSEDRNFQYDGQRFDFSISLFHDAEHKRPLGENYDCIVTRVDGTKEQLTVEHGGCVQIAAGDVIEVVGLPAGSYYIANESRYPGYIADDANGAAAGTIVPGQAIDMPFTNTYTNKTLSVEKRVEGDIPQSKEFKVTLHLFKNGEEYKDEITSNSGKYTSGKTFVMRHGDYRVFDIPEGVEWLFVQEAEYDEYDNSVEYTGYNDELGIEQDKVVEGCAIGSREVEAVSGPQAAVLVSKYTEPEEEPFFALPSVGSHMMLAISMTGIIVIVGSLAAMMRTILRHKRVR